MRLTERPPLRAAWTRVGEQACEPITGHRGGCCMEWAVLLPRAEAWKQEAFQKALRLMHRRWRIALLIGRGSAHTAKVSWRLAA